MIRVLLSYVQYAFARISGILRKLDDPESLIILDSVRLSNLLSGERERNLMRLLETIPMRVMAAGTALEPHRISDYLAETAKAFHSFYQFHKVIDSENTEITAARVTLCIAARSTLNDLLTILGVSAPEKM